MSGQNLKISDPLTLEQIEKIYADLVLQQDFYDIDYASGWLENIEPAIDMATFIKKMIKPEKTLDIGCGVGNLIGELRKKGIDAKGVEFSDAFIHASPMKQYILKGNIMDDYIHPGEYDLIVCTEVLEHLPPTYLNKAIRNLKRMGHKTILISVPMFGPNRFGYAGLPLNEKCWLEDARENRPFKNLVVDENGIPHLGHISLGSYEWWTRKFLMNGLIRDIKIERKGYISHNFLKNNLNIFILNRLDIDHVDIIHQNFFTVGFFDVEDWGGERGRIRWTEKKFDIWLQFSKSVHEIFIEFYSGPREIVYERKLRIRGKRLFESKNLQSEEQEVCDDILKILPDTWYIYKIPVSIQSHEVFHFECELDNAFIPEYLLRNGDYRSLGIALKSFGSIS